MTIQSKILSGNHSFIITLLILALAPIAYADNYYPMMPGNCMGMDHMGTGQRGMRPMMGMDHMGMGHRGMGSMMGMDHMGKYGSHFQMLGLTNSQRKAMRDIQRKNRTERIELQDKVTDYSDQLYSLYDQDKPDAKKIGEIYQKIFNLKRQIIELRINTKNQKYDKLTKDQQEKLKELKSNWMGRYDRNAKNRGMMQHMMR